MVDPERDELAGRILASLERRYAERAPYREDRELAAEIAIEARPAVESLILAAGADAAERARVLDHHEGLAMITLLGRRVGMLGATPTAALSTMCALFDAFDEAERPVPEDLHEDLRALCMEGYVAGREERLVERAAARAADGQLPVRHVEGCLVLVLAGEHSAESLEQIVDRFGRDMLKTDAGAGLVDVTRLTGPSPDRAAEVFSAHVAARMLGATCIFSGVSDEWLAAAREGRVDVEILTLEPTFEEGLRHALRVAGWELRRISRLPGPLRTLFGRG